MIAKGALPELLAPAGTPAALQAALQGGADAIYFGGTDFNARMRAQNFTPETMAESIALCHAFGARAYITLNTLATDRELPRVLQAAEQAYLEGADALIVADPGAAALIHRHLPDFELHASTQCAGHNIAAAQQLKKWGFSRMVLARESTAVNIADFVKNSGVETEIFVHGALCVSHSGQCLFSSLVGGRSGNRGECAQPCRLPDSRGRYPLSLKDLSLARHVPQLIEMGVDSLKIEGRLKSPTYVYHVVSIWRRLLDERRAATDAEMQHLGAIFSRGGFTDAYFTGQTGRKMMGLRSEEEKQLAKNVTPFEGLTRTVPLSLALTMQRDMPLTLTATTAHESVTVTAEPPLVARNAPMDRAAVERSLCKLGGTPYSLKCVDVTLDEGLMVPVSRLNALRRAALDALVAHGRKLSQNKDKSAQAEGKSSRTGVEITPSARFLHAAQITEAACAAFPLRYLPLHAFAPPANGVILPPVIFDNEADGVRKALHEAKQRGAVHALVSNIGHLHFAKEAGLLPHGDFRLNICNGVALSALLPLGFCDALLSPELTLAQIRDIKGARDVIVYGRVPLMLLEKCAGRELGDCAHCAKDENELVDRRGERFPVLRLPPHRNVLYNSRPTVMSDRKQELLRAGISAGHFIFSVESPREVDGVLHAYRTGEMLQGALRRI